MSNAIQSSELMYSSRPVDTILAMFDLVQASSV